MDRFIVTGCARSGTGYTAQAFQRAGIQCGHEGAFGPRQVVYGADPTWEDLQGDSSWLAAPLLRDHDGPAILQVRHPLAVIRSLVGMEMLSDLSTHGLYMEAVVATIPGLMQEHPGPNRTARYWVEWNKMAADQAHLRWKVEDIPRLLHRVISALGFSTDGLLPTVDVPTDYNSRTYSFMRRANWVTWADVRSPLVAEVEEMASWLGYNMEYV